jgi:hypothetical protein
VLTLTNTLAAPNGTDRLTTSSVSAPQTVGGALTFNTGGIEVLLGECPATTVLSAGTFLSAASTSGCDASRSTAGPFTSSAGTGIYRWIAASFDKAP